jgi:hypothetical protein
MRFDNIEYVAAQESIKAYLAPVGDDAVLIDWMMNIGDYCNPISAAVNCITDIDKTWIDDDPAVSEKNWGEYADQIEQDIRMRIKRMKEE